MTRGRGHYTTRLSAANATFGSFSTAAVGACAVDFEHSLRLVQRYDQVKLDAMQALLTSLAHDSDSSLVAGRDATSVNAQRWQINLANYGAIVRLLWEPALGGALVVTIESKRPHRAADTPAVRHQFEGILDEKIEPLLRLFGATAVGAALEGPADAHVGQSTDRVTTIVVEKKPSALSKVIGVFAVVGAVLWGRHQSRQIERLYQRLEVPYQTFADSLREGAGSSLRSIADRVRFKRQARGQSRGRS